MSSFPPGPRGSPLVQMFRFLREPLPLFDACIRQFGELFTLRLGRQPWVFVSSPQHVQALFQADPDVFRAGVAKRSIFGPIVGETSSLVLDGAPHLARRRLLLPAFNGERMLVYTELARELAERSVASWPQGEVFSLHEPLQRIAFLSIVDGIFGIPPEDETHPLLGHLTRLTHDVVGSKLLFTRSLQRDWGRFSPWGRLMHIVRAADAALYAEIRRRRAEADSGREDILAMLLRARDEQGQALDDRALRDELVTMVIAGQEITGLSLAWAVAAFLSHPEALEKIQAELRAVVGGGRVERAHVPRLTYLDAAIRESLRMYSAVMNGSARQLSREAEFAGFTLPAGTMMSTCVHALHRRPELYPEPEVFRPERFLERKYGPYEWIPFGGGTRRCLGMAFALHEMKVILATVLSRVRLELAQGSIRPVRRGAFFGPEGGPRVRVVERFPTPA